MKPTLTLSKDGQQIKEFPLDKRTVVGREDDTDITISGPGVSRRHAAIVQDRRGFYVEDLQSSNGTRVNGRVVKRVRLKNQDEIDIAGFVLRFTGQVAAAVIPSADVTLVPESHSSTSVVGATDASVPDFREIVERTDDALKHRLDIFFELAGEISGTFEVDELLSKILDALFRVFDQAHRGTIMLIDPETGELTPKAVKRRHGVDEGQIAVSMTVINRTIQERHALLCQDAMSDDRFQGAESVMNLQIRSLMCAPLIAKNEIVGVVVIDTTDAMRPFEEADLNMLSSIAAQPAMAIRNGQLYEEKVKSERLAMVGQTIAGLAHCVKNILNGIMGGGYILEVGLKRDDSEKVAKGWDMVKRNNEFMRGLVLDMLTYAKDREPEYVLTDANEIVQDVCGLMEERAKQGGIELCQATDANMKLTAMDKTQIQRCVLNLTTNAIDACIDHGTKVTVGTSLDEDEGEVCIAIADDGCGISEENQKKLFQVFFSTKGSKGTGLGLAVTHKIIEEHGGSLDVDSAEGEGTTFTIRLPFMEEPPSDPSATEETKTDTNIGAPANAEDS